MSTNETFKPSIDLLVATLERVETKLDRLLALRLTDAEKLTDSLDLIDGMIIKNMDQAARELEQDIGSSYGVTTDVTIDTSEGTSDKICEVCEVCGLFKATTQIADSHYCDLHLPDLSKHHWEFFPNAKIFQCSQCSQIVKELSLGDQDQDQPCPAAKTSSTLSDGIYEKNIANLGKPIGTSADEPALNDAEIGALGELYTLVSPMAVKLSDYPLVFPLLVNKKLVELDSGSGDYILSELGRKRFEIAQGITPMIPSEPEPTTCPDCNGTGKRPDTISGGTRKCFTCRGKGKGVLRPKPEPDVDNPFPSDTIATTGNGTSADEPEPTTYLGKFKAALKDKYFLILDTETTGLYEGEICQIAIITNTGKMLLDTYIKTVQPIPAESTKIHGITDEMVKDAPTWAEIVTKVTALLSQNIVVVYNASYDRKMMHQTAERNSLEKTDWKIISTWYCAMEAYAEHYGDWNDYHQSYRWQKLSNAARNEKVIVKDAHNALGDCKMTLGIINAMLTDPTTEKPDYQPSEKQEAQS